MGPLRNACKPHRYLWLGIDLKYCAKASQRHREILSTPPKPDEEMVKEMGLDKLDVSRLKELKALLGALEQLKGGEEQ